MNHNDHKNYYEVLEIASSATHQDIHNAYKRAKNAYSGDSAALYSLMTQEECDHILNQIEEAYSILGVPEKRRQYDTARGLNQTHTPEGFQEKLFSQKDYTPQRSLSDLIHDSKDIEQDRYIEQEALREEFKYQDSSTPKTQARVTKVQAYKKFHLDYEVNQKFEQEIENTTKFTGELLGRVREYKKVSIERMAEMTKVSKTYIKAIEASDYDKLPAEVYARGFVYQYAKCLRLNPDLVATSYIALMRDAKQTLKNAQ